MQVSAPVGSSLRDLGGGENFLSGLPLSIWFIESRDEATD